MGVTADIGEAVSITNFFNLPSTRFQILVLSIISTLFSVLLFYFESNNVLYSILKSFFLLFVPTILSSLLFRIVRNISLKRAHFLMLISAIVYFIVYSVYFVTANFNVLILGYSFVFLLIIGIGYLAFRMKYSAVLFSLIQLLLFLLTLYYLEDISSNPNLIIFKLALSSLLMVVFAYIITFVFDAPLRKAFSINSTTAISKFVSQWLYDSKDLEEEFERIGSDVDLGVDSILFTNDQGTCLLTIPQVHFGPIGNLGGSNFPYLIAERLENIVDSVVVMHAPITHDYNPVSSKEVDKIIIAIEEFLKSHRSNSVKVGFLETEHGAAKAHHLFFGNKALLSSFTRHPKTTEDMDYGLGLLLKEKGKSYVNNILIADEHNSETGTITQFILGSDEANEYLRAMDKLSGKIESLKFHKMKFAFGKWVDDTHFNYGISDNGISYLVFISKAFSIAYIIFDSNGISPDAKSNLEHIIKEIGFDKVIIMTTDSHKLNKVSAVVNPVSFDDFLFSHIKEDLLNLKMAASPFRMDSSSKLVSMRVFGPMQSLKLINTFNALVAFAKFMLPTMFLASILAILWALSKI